MTTAPLDDEPWRLIEPLLPVKKRRFHHPGRKRLDDRRMTCWRRLKEWQQAGVFQAL